MATPRKKPSERLPVGRPPKYRPEFVEQVEKLARLGATDEQIADFFGVTAKTIYEWKNKHPAFGEANARGKPDVNAEVERSLLQLAKGHFTVKEVTRDGDGNIIKTVEKEIPPDATSATKWLFNRDPDRWREKQEIALSGNIGMEVMTPEQYEAAKAKFLAENKGAVK